MRLSTPPMTTFESSQRRSAARLAHCSGTQCAEGNCCSTAFSEAPRATPFASYAAPAAPAERRARARIALICVILSCARRSGKRGLSLIWGAGSCGRHVAGEAAEEVEHALAPGRERVFRTEQLVRAHYARPLENREQDVVAVRRSSPQT